jgi:hypothetical protein
MTPDASHTGHSSDRWGFLATAATVFTTVAFLLHEICSLDVWWQVAIGRHILETLSIPAIDRFAAAALGRPYHDSHWLFQVVLGSSHEALGMVGVQVAMIGLWGLALGSCHAATRRWTSTTTAAILVFLAAMASVERFLPRPELLSFVGITSFYYLLQQHRYRSYRHLAVLGAVQIVWANSHGLFVIGPFMVACYWLVAAAERIRRRDTDFPALSRALAVVLAATALTPWGPAGWRYAAVLLSEVGPGGPLVTQHLGELSDTFGAVARTSPAFWFFLVLLVPAGIAVVYSLVRRRLTPRLLIVVGLGAAALTGRRNIVLFVLVAAPFLGESLAHLPSLSRRASRARSITAAVLMAAWAWFPLSGSYYLAMEIPARFGLGVTPSFFPHRLPAFLDEIGFDGQILNSNTLGGFYLYHGYPRRLPLIDGRWEVYEPDLLRQVLSGSQDPIGWRQLVPRFGIRGLLFAHTSPEARALLPGLRQSTDWRLVYYDRAASFWIAADHPSAPPVIDLDDPATLPEPGRPDDGLILHAFLSRVGASDLALLNLQRTLEFGVRRRLLLEQLGALQIKTERFEDAEATYEALLHVDPRSTAALNELAFLAYRRGDLAKAAELIQRLVDIAPDNPKYQENYRRVMEGMSRPGDAPAPGTRPRSR